MGFLANAPIGAHVNLIIQMGLLSLLLIGTYLARARRLKVHGRIMGSAMVIQVVALIFWMGASLVVNSGAFATFGPGQLITILHVIVGYVAFFLAISSSLHKTIVSQWLGWTMRASLLVWVLAAVTGIGFYVYYYF